MSDMSAARVDMLTVIAQSFLDDPNLKRKVGKDPSLKDIETQMHKLWSPEEIAIYLQDPFRKRFGACMTCRKYAPQLKKCSACKCKHDRYCSRACQVKDWPTHSKTCGRCECVVREEGVP